MHLLSDIVGICIIYHSTKFHQHRAIHNWITDRTILTKQLSRELSSNRHHWNTLYMVIHNLQGMALSVIIWLLTKTRLAQFKTDAVLTTKLEYAGFFFLVGSSHSFWLHIYRCGPTTFELIKYANDDRDLRYLPRTSIGIINNVFIRNSGPCSTSTSTSRVRHRRLGLEIPFEFFLGICYFYEVSS